MALIMPPVCHISCYSPTYCTKNMGGFLTDMYANLYFFPGKEKGKEAKEFGAGYAQIPEDSISVLPLIVCGKVVEDSC